MKRFLVLAALILPATWMVACSDDDLEEDVQQAAEDVENAAGQVSARAVAETLRGSLLAQEGDVDVRSVTVLNDAVADLPGDEPPEVSGIADDDGDGLDDDLRVQVSVEDQSACLVLAEAGDSIDIENNAC